MNKTAIIIGAGGFIGSHVARRLKRDGYWVRGVDLKYPEFAATTCDEFYIGDCRRQGVVDSIIDRKVDRVFQFAADMGGVEYIGMGKNDANIMSNNAKINFNVVEAAHRQGVDQIFFSSSACVYNKHNQMNTENPDCREHTAYPANPDSNYGWEKLFAERLYLAYNHHYGMRNRIARFHNIFGEYGTWRGGREKAPAAICRKIAEVTEGGEIEIFGDGKQTRSFLHIDDCVEGIMRLMDSDFEGPINIGSDHLITINDLVLMVAGIADKTITIKHIDGPQGVRGRNSNNDLIREKLGWAPKQDLYLGITKTYQWIQEQVKLYGEQN